MVSHGNFNNTNRLLGNLQKMTFVDILNAAGRAGVAALSAATPKETGSTADQWDYEIITNDNGLSVHWTNTNFGDGWFPVVIGLQYGHGTGTGGWVSGIDYINPAMQPIFDTIAENAWREVKKA